MTPEEAYRIFLDESIDVNDPYWDKIDKINDVWREIKDLTFKAGFIEGYKRGLLSKGTQIGEVGAKIKIKKFFK